MYAIKTRPSCAGGSFYFRLLMNGVSPEAVDGISIAYIDTRATPSRVDVPNFVVVSRLRVLSGWCPTDSGTR